MKGAIIALVVVLVLAIGGFGTYIGMSTKVRDQGYRYEQTIKTTHKEMENIHSKVYKTIAGKGQVVSKYSEDFQNILKAYVQGGGDKKAVMSSIREAIPNLDQSMYKDIMRTIESGHLEFAQIQKRKLDVIGQYELYLKTGYFKPMLLRGQGLPSIDLEEYGEVISVGVTKNVMETKEDVVQKVF